MNRLALLARKDKWFLGGGKGALYAPPFPKNLHAIGFWDECYLADIRVPRLFTALLLNEDGSPIRLRTEVIQWRPDRLILEHRAAGVRLIETRCVTEGNAWASELNLVQSPTQLHMIQWSLMDL